MNELRSIRFNTRSGKYTSGDIASFKPGDAEVYVKAGVATYCQLNAAGKLVSPAAEPEAEAAKGDDEGKGDNEGKTNKKGLSRKRVRSMEGGKSGGYETKGK